MLSRADIENGERRAVERVVLMRENMSEVASRCAASTCLPSHSLRSGTSIAAGSGGARRKNRSTRASRSGRRFPRNAEIGRKARIPLDRMVAYRIERVVDRHAARGTEALISFDDRRRRRRRLGLGRGRRAHGAPGDPRASRISSSVAAASTPRKSLSAPGRESQTTPLIKTRHSKTPTPLALTTMSAAGRFLEHPRAIRPVRGRRRRRAQSAAAPSRCCCRSYASGS